MKKMKKGYKKWLVIDAENYLKYTRNRYQNMS